MFADERLLTPEERARILAPLMPTAQRPRRSGRFATPAHLVEEVAGDVFVVELCALAQFE